MVQGESETINQLAVRLKQKAQQCEQCDYGNQLEAQIRDQMISKCRSKELRRKILEKFQTLSFKLCKNWHGIMKWSRGKQKEHVYPLGQSIESLTAFPGRTVEIPVHRQVVSVTDVEERFILPKMSVVRPVPSKRKHA